MSDNMSLRPNLGTTERVISTLGGSFLLYNVLSQREKSISKLLAGGYLLFRGVSGHCYIYEAGFDGKTKERGKIKIDTHLTVNKPRNEVYNFWHKLENLPRFMKHLENVTTLDDKVSEWTARIPGNMGTISWRSEIVEDEKDEKISWKSVPDSTIENEGTTHFRDAGKFGTEIHVIINYSAPLGTPGESVAKMLNPAFKEMVQEDIKNFRRYMETGEIPTTEGQPSGR